MRGGKGGGHAYSLGQISSSLYNSSNEICILSIGIRESQNFQGLPYYYGNIYFNGTNYFRAAREIKNCVSAFSPDIIHCFDYSCYNVFKSLRLGKQYKFVLNKCGGPNKQDYPIAERVILFSKENQNWFEINAKYKKTTFYLIPNRVERVKLEEQVEVKKTSENIFTFVRIIRIGETYKQSILNSINLIEELNNRGIGVQLYLIGVVQDLEVYKEILRYSENKKIIFLTEDKYTKRASKMLYLADAVIATGRGVMEASSLHLPVLSVTNNCRYPVLITESNFERFFEVNFSGRLALSDKELDISNIERVIMDKKFSNKCGKFMLEKFDILFDVDRAKENYLRVYNDALVDTSRIPSYFDLLNKVRTFRSFFVHSRRFR